MQGKGSSGFAIYAGLGYNFFVNTVQRGRFLLDTRETKIKPDKQESILIVFLTFMTGCITGWIYEMGFYRIDVGHFIKRGQGLGPWLPIYGFGALAITVLFYNRKHLPAIVFLGSAIAAAIIEFLTGWTLFHFFDGLRLWDYNTEIWNWGNIGGYICLRSVLVFGFAGLFCIYIVLPEIEAFAYRIRKNSYTPVVFLLGMIAVTDLVIGYIIKPILIWTLQGRI